MKKRQNGPRAGLAAGKAPGRRPGWGAPESLAPTAEHDRLGSTPSADRIRAESDDSPAVFRLEASYKNLERVIGWIGNADNKALILLAFQGVILAGAAAVAGFIRMALLRQPTEWLFWGLCVTLVVLASLFVACTCSAVHALHPDVKPRGAKVGQGSPFFFGSIAAMELAAFTAKMRGLDAVAIEGELIKQTHVNAVIVSRKFTWLKRAARLLVAELAFLAVAAAIVVSTPPRSP